VLEANRVTSTAGCAVIWLYQTAWEFSFLWSSWRRALKDPPTQLRELKPNQAQARATRQNQPDHLLAPANSKSEIRNPKSVAMSGKSEIRLRFQLRRDKSEIPGLAGMHS